MRKSAVLTIVLCALLSNAVRAEDPVCFADANLNVVFRRYFLKLAPASLAETCIRVQNCNFRDAQFLKSQKNLAGCITIFLRGFENVFGKRVDDDFSGGARNGTRTIFIGGEWQ